MTSPGLTEYITGLLGVYKFASKAEKIKLLNQAEQLFAATLLTDIYF